MAGKKTNGISRTLSSVFIFNCEIRRKSASAVFLSSFIFHTHGRLDNPKFLFSTRACYGPVRRTKNPSSSKTPTPKNVRCTVGRRHRKITDLDLTPFFPQNKFSQRKWMFSKRTTQNFTLFHVSSYRRITQQIGIVYTTSFVLLDLIRVKITPVDKNSRTGEYINLATIP